MTRPEQLNHAGVRVRSRLPARAPVSIWAVLGLGAAIGLFTVSTSEASYYYNYGGYYGYGYRYQPRTIRRSRPVTRKRVRKPRQQEAVQKTPAKPIKGPLTVVVSIGEQRVRVFDATEQVAESRTSTGVRGYDTLRGVFSVIQKNRHHYSNLYNNAPMPYMQRLTWTGTAMHTGVVTGRPASHGCIRLPNSFAARLWQMTKLGTRVIVARNGVEPVAISHPTLANLRQTPLAEAIARMEAAAGKLAANANEGSITDGLGTPMPDLRLTKEPAASAENEVRMAPAKPSASPAVAPEIIAAPVVAMGSDAAEKAAAAPAQTPSAPVVAMGSDAQGTGVAPAASDPVPVPEPAPALLKQLKPGPLAIFVSRKEGRLFVRKAFEPVFDMPIKIANPELPLGTHVYTATGYNDDQTTFQWMAISLPPEQRAVKRSKRRGRGHAVSEADAPVIAAASATEALSRVEIPKAVLDRIGYLLEPGSSLTISDKGLGSYTGKGTGFIVLSR
ncbi:MAG: L,D-transpeptidase [Xanthobacteraceae bacterium]